MRASYVTQDNQNADDGKTSRTHLNMGATTLTSRRKNQDLFRLPFHKIKS